MKIQAETNVIASNSFIELLALKCEADGMLAENHYRQSFGNTPAYNETDFQIVAEKMRALKTMEAKPEQPTTSQGQNAQSSTSAIG